MRAFRSAPASCAILCGVLACIAPSAGASVTIGQTSSAASNCGTVSEVQISTGPAPGYVVPVGGGVITSWHSAGNGTDTGNLKLKVWTPTSDPMKWVVGGQSGTETQTPSGPNLYNTRVPVQGGERLGVYVVTSSPACIFTTAAGSDVILQGAADVA